VLNLSFQYKKPPLINLNQAFGMNPVNNRDPFGEENWSQFLTSKEEFLKWRLKRGYSKEASIELLKRVHLFRVNQQNSFVDRIPGWGWYWLGGALETGEAISDQIDNAKKEFTEPKRILKNLKKIPGAIKYVMDNPDLGLGKRIGHTARQAMDAGADPITAIQFGIGQEIYNLTPIEEVKTFLDPNNPVDIRAKAVFTFEVKMGSYILTAKGMSQNNAQMSSTSFSTTESRFNLVQLSEAHITDTGETVLGSYPGYIIKARARGASYFDIENAWNVITNEQRLSANHHFLDVISSRGDKVLLSIRKGLIQPNTWLSKEIYYLRMYKGYKWVNQWALVKR
jgi:hypothetical protein